MFCVIDYNISEQSQSPPSSWKHTVYLEFTKSPEDVTSPWKLKSARDFDAILGLWVWSPKCRRSLVQQWKSVTSLLRLAQNKSPVQVSIFDHSLSTTASHQQLTRNPSFREVQMQHSPRPPFILHEAWFLGIIIGKCPPGIYRYFHVSAARILFW